MTPFLIVADRGCLKAFHVEPNPGRPPTPRLIEERVIEEGRGRLLDKLSDQAGAFPNGGTLGQGNSIAEQQGLVAEIEMRSFRKVAGRMIELLEEHRPARWGFAAPREINGAILDGLPETWKGRLARNVSRDLVNTPTPELLRHFE